jgi:diguanylate cyclase (GGDEF)-like protein
MYMNMGERSAGRRPAAPTDRPDRVDAGRTWVFRCLAVAAPVVAAAVPARYGLTGRPWEAFCTGLALSGVIATTTAVLLITWWIAVRRSHPVEVFRLLMAVAVLFWGVGQAVTAFEAAGGAVGYPSIGDVIGSVAAPIALAAILSLPRHSVSTRPGLRLILDSLAVGSAVTFLLLRMVVAVPAAGLSIDHLGTGVFVLADCSVFAALLLTAVRDVRSGVWPIAVGVLLHVIADLGAVFAVEKGGPRVDPWLSMSLWCLAWPLMGIGVTRFRPAALAVGGSAQDRRESTASQFATLIILPTVVAGFLIGGLSHTGAGSRGNLLLAVVFVPLMFTREIMSARLQLRLTSGLRTQAFRDSLTGLPNRRALTTRIDELDADDVLRVVLTLDLDDFKQVNDLLGHHAGDALLIAVADTLQRHSPPQSLIARIGGDEFAVLCPGDLDEGRALGERLRTAVGNALALKAPGVGISASVGVGRLVRSGVQESGCPSPAATPAAGPGRAGSEPAASAPVAVPVSRPEHRDQLTGLVESAAALRTAKENGRDAVQVYDSDMAKARQRRLLLEHRLRQAIADQVIITYGQPIVDLGTGRLTGFESLARWNDAELGFVPPDEFIEVAEQTGLVVALGEHLLAETLAAATRAGVFAAGLTLSVNASPIQLRVPGFVELLRERMARHGISPKQVIIEITEAILVTEGDPAVSTLAEINALGIGLAIDDFGTGYSALGYLRRLPVQVIKIDKSLTSCLLTESKTVAIVEGVARMAHRMGVRVVMEGIENELEADSCRAVGADRGQGYLFGRPTSWDQAAILIAEMSATPERPRPTTPTPTPTKSTQLR